MHNHRNTARPRDFFFHLLITISDISALAPLLTRYNYISRSRLTRNIVYQKIGARVWRIFGREILSRARRVMKVAVSCYACRLAARLRTRTDTLHEVYVQRQEFQ